MMERALAGLLLFVLLTPGGATERDAPGLCRVWRPETKPYFVIFPCPGKNDSRDAVFCCGSCSTPYCCSSEEDQLDQRRCYAELFSTTPPPVVLPYDWYIMSFILCLVAFAVGYTCANHFSTCIRDWLRRASCVRTFRWRCCPPHQDVQVVQMASLPTPSDTHAGLPTVSTSPKESAGATVYPPRLDTTPIRGRLRTSGIPENDAIVLSPAALQNTSVSCPTLEAAVAMENSGARP